jgi:hypothetical protein
MNFAIGKTQATGWKRLKVGYVVAAAALALAVTAAVGIAFARDGGSGPSAAPSIVQPAPQARLQPPLTYIYVVSSQEEAIPLETMLDEARTLAITNDLYEVLVVDTPEAEASLQLAQKELADAGLPGTPSGVTLVDTR